MYMNIFFPFYELINLRNVRHMTYFNNDNNIKNFNIINHQFKIILQFVSSFLYK